MENKLSKKLILIITLVGILIILGILIYLWPIIKSVKEKPAPAERTLEEILKEDLTALPGEVPPVPEEIIKDLTAPPSEEKIPEDVLKNLTAPE